MSTSDTTTLLLLLLPFLLLRNPNRYEWLRKIPLMICVFIISKALVLLLCWLCFFAIYRKRYATIYLFHPARKIWTNLILTLALGNAIDYIIYNRFLKMASNSKRSSGIRYPADMQLDVGGLPFCLDMNLLMQKSGKISAILKENSEDHLCHFFRNIPSNTETFELVCRFCYGYNLQITTENVVPLACLAFYLGMTESHCPNNLLQKTITFFEQKILHSWNKTINAYRATENFHQQALQLGLVDACLESIVAKVEANPCFLGKPIENWGVDDDECGEIGDVERGKNARRKLFLSEMEFEDLTMLPLQLYEPAIAAMNKHGVKSNYVASSLCNYLKKWVFSGSTEDGKMVVHMTNSKREIIEAVERIMPHERGLFPCTLLFEMLRFCIYLEANLECKNGFEFRIGKQLDQATVSDLSIPIQGYAKELDYDIESLKRILKHFYRNYSGSNMAAIIGVAQLIDDFLLEVASDKDLSTNAFISLAEMTIAASNETGRSSDGIYKAIDTYLAKHSFLTDSEKDEVCKVLDCHKMSTEACEHAARNERLPLRIVVQVLFLGQLQLRNAITSEMQSSEGRPNEVEDGEEEEKMAMSEGLARSEMKRMSNRVMELERECESMRREIEGGCSQSQMVKREKGSVWTEVKRKFGCMSKMNNCNCQVKKKKIHPR